MRKYESLIEYEIAMVAQRGNGKSLGQLEIIDSLMKKEN